MQNAQTVTTLMTCILHTVFDDIRPIFANLQRHLINLLRHKIISKIINDQIKLLSNKFHY